MCKLWALSSSGSLKSKSDRSDRFSLAKMTTQNRGLIYKALPSGKPIAGTHLKVEDRPIDVSALEPPQNGLFVKVHYVSFDPFQRGRMRDPATSKSYSPPFEIGKPIANSAISSVVKSQSAKFQPGDLVLIPGSCPTEEYSEIPEQVVSQAVRKLENPRGIDVKHFLGALGMPGLTAFASMREIANPKPGETFFVSAASGAVGALAGQIAKKEGMKVIGSVGDDAKLAYIIDELGFDDGFNYKKEKPADAVKRLAPEGLDVYYDNVGGEQLEVAIGAMKSYGRIGKLQLLESQAFDLASLSDTVACGMISQYNLSPSEQ